MGNGPLCGDEGVGGPGALAQLLHHVTGALHAPAPGLGSGSAQPRGAQPLSQQVLCM